MTSSLTENQFSGKTYFYNCLQGKCAEAMKLWGYRSYASEAELDSVHPVDELTM